MTKRLWYSFYLATGIGVIVGVAVRAGAGYFRLGSFPDPIAMAISLFHLGSAMGLYFTMISYAAIIGCVALVAYKLARTLSGSWEGGAYAIGLGFFGGLVFVLGLIGMASIVGLALLFIGAFLVLQREREPPGSPPEESRGVFDPFK